MEIYLGGSYQGKLAAARVKEGDIYYCNERIEYHKVISGVHITLRACLEANIPFVFDFDQAKDSLLCIDECNQGIVPINKVDRQYREQLGEFIQEACAKANKVTYFIAGLEWVLKDE